jgi:hypothetical protein
LRPWAPNIQNAPSAIKEQKKYSQPVRLNLKVADGMQTAIHPPGPRAIKNQNKSEIDSTTPAPVHCVTDNYLNYLINLNIDPSAKSGSVPLHRSDFFMVK